MSLFSDIAIVWSKYGTQILSGIGNTVLISIIGTLAGLLIGLLNGVIRTIPKTKRAFTRGVMRVVNWIISAYVEVFRGTPMMVQAMIIYWGYAYMNGGASLPLIPAGIVIVSINTGAYITEIVRGGIIAVDRGQFEGAMSIGMSHFSTMIHIIIPQVMRNILPAVSNEFVVNIKDTSVLNVIGVTELYFYAASAAKNSYKIFASYLIACAIYFCLTFTITRILRLIEKKIEGKANYSIFGSQSDSASEIHINEEETANA
ncbi:MAG: amino acid ABC transporter permease [Clostridia bacterium]|nr:amino acid ABC transporter permease [Clostridia bacterium]